jgi:hypothetical protein
VLTSFNHIVDNLTGWDCVEGVDGDPAAAWLCAPHRGETSWSRLRQRYARSSCRAFQVESLLNISRARCLARYLSHEAAYETVHALRAPHAAQEGVILRGQHVTRDEWQASASDQRLFRFDTLIVPGEYSEGAAMFVDFALFLRSAQFRALLSQATGEPLGEIHVEAHRMQAGDFVGLHSDARARRRLAMVLYLSEGWDRADGGLFLMTENNGQTRVFTPSFNSLLVFSPSGHLGHCVSPVTSRQPRLSINAWCLDPA